MYPLHKDVFGGNAFDHVISNYLDIKDIYNLSLTCNYLYNRFKKQYVEMHIKRRIEYHLKQIFKESYNVFIEHMIASRSVIVPLPRRNPALELTLVFDVNPLLSSTNTQSTTPAGISVTLSVP